MEAPRLWLCATIASFALLHATSLRAADPPSAEAFGTIPEISHVELSPDGRLLAWHSLGPKGSHAITFDLDAGTHKRAFPLESIAKLRELTWADNETLLITVSAFGTFGQRSAVDHYEVFRTYSANVSDGEVRMLLMRDGARQFVTGADLIAWRTSKPKTVIMSTLDYAEASARQQTGSNIAVGRKDQGWVGQLFEVDTRTGKGVRIAMGSAFTVDWIVDKSGKAVARSEWRPAQSLFTILARDGGGWKELLSEKDQAQGVRTLYGLTADETALVISATTSAGRRTLWMLPLDGSAGRPLLENETEDISHLSFDRITRTPITAWLGGAEPKAHWLDPAAEKSFRRVAGAFKGKMVRVYGRSEDGQRVVAEVQSPSNPPVFYFVNLAKGTADTVGEAYPGLTNATLGEVRAISYEARDGAMVPAYLTVPPGSDGKNLPLVVLPHGGPEYRDEYAFDWWAQFLAVRGYAVLQPQFRGSTGFGEAWRRAGYRQWGGLMQDDVTDGVRAMIEQGVADAARVCIVGGSYGGYAALAGVAFTPELYRCAVSVNGVADLVRMLGYAKERGGAESNQLAYWREHIGTANDPNVIGKSPLRAAANIKAPVLLMHAVNDTVVPQTQSEAMARELQKLNKSVTYVPLAGEDHWLSQSATRVQMLKELEKFLSQHLRKT